MIETVAAPAPAPAMAASGADCPYPGLRPFSEREASLFFGREPEIANVVTMLEDRQLVVVHGASGCGKSSVVRAGVVPLFRLDALANSREGRVVIIRPGDPGGPVMTLARKLDAELPRPAPEGGGEEVLGRSWSTLLAASPDWAADIAAAAGAAGVTLCLIVDQFEEIFAAAKGCYPAEAARLVQFLVGLGEAAAAGTGLGERSLSVILTMRSDYLGGCAQWEGFAEAVNRCQYLLPRLSTYGALRSIHEPARCAGGEIADAVVDRLLAVIAREIDGLPILQHALMRAWRHAARRGGRTVVDLDALATIGGADHALSKHADEVADALARETPGIDPTINWVFRSLSDIDTDKRIIRRSIPIRQLSWETGAPPADVRRIVEAFRRPEHSLVSPFLPDPLEEDSIVTVGHEALLRQWTRISDPATGLAVREFQDGLIWRTLAVQAGEFARDGSTVLGAAATEQRLPWYREIAKRPGWITRHLVASGSGQIEGQAQWDQVTAFIKASETKVQRERRRDRLMRYWIVFLLALLLVVSSAAFYQRTDDQNRIIAAKSEGLIQAQTVAANAQAAKYCLARSADNRPDPQCLKSMTLLFFSRLNRDEALRSTQAPAVPESPFQGGSGIGYVRQGDGR